MPGPQPLIGPQKGPDVGAAGPSYPPLEEDPELEGASTAPPGAADSLPIPPGSPYSAERAAVRSLTMPAVADTEIPPSPPGSPPAATDRKFAQFLELKAKGVHFNAKVASSPALRNPALADKLLAFVGCGGARDGAQQQQQYATTLGPDLWDPAAFPRWAFREQLRAAQSDAAHARARGRGAAVDFVPAAGAGAGAGAGSGPGSGTGMLGGERRSATPGASTGTNTGTRKTRFDK